MGSCYHVVIQLKDKKHLLLFSDLSVQELKEKFLKTYKKKKPFFKNGLKIEYSEIKKTKIRRTEFPLKEELKTFREEERKRIDEFNRDPSFTLISLGRGREEVDIRYRGIDVTNKYINSSLNEESFNLKWINNPWIVTIVGGLILFILTISISNLFRDNVISETPSSTEKGTDTTLVPQKKINEPISKEVILSIRVESFDFIRIAEGDNFLPAEYFWELFLYKRDVNEKILIGRVAGNKISNNNKDLKIIHAPGLYPIGKSNSFSVSADSAYFLIFLAEEVDQFELEDSRPTEVNDRYECTDSGDFNIKELKKISNGKLVIRCSYSRADDLFINITYSIN
ncbi:MAG: hypothetical protein ED557_03865 [Balneola sp.]|nr:MAG: hypothetical protein ED557_03865 [Balneola sp.]